MKNAIRTFAMAAIACLAMTACNKQYTITVVSNNNDWGITNGSGTYDEGATVQISGTPAIGYRFVQWNDGVKDNPRTITVDGDATYVVVFGDINGGSGSGEGGGSQDPQDIVADSNAHFTLTFGDTTWTPTVLVKSNMGDVYAFLVYDNDNPDNFFFSFSCPLATGTYSYAQNPRYSCYFMENSDDYDTIGGQQYPHWLAVQQCVINITEYDATRNLLSGTINAQLLNMEREAQGLSQEFRAISVDFEKVYMNEYQQ